jgi:hypothetical protein
MADPTPYSWPGLAQDPGRDMHRDPADVIADQLAFAGVQPDPDLEAVLGQLGPDGVGRTDGPAGPSIVGHGLVQDLRGGHDDLASEEPVHQRVAVAFDELALAI